MLSLLVIDNFDSFTYNLVQLAGALGAEPLVRRNNAVTVEEALALAPSAILISPGPGEPRHAGISVPLIRAAAAARIPLLGVCLGHQAIGEAFGGRIVRADRLMHGKTTVIRHDGAGVYQGLMNPLQVMRYHSLVVQPESVPSVLEIAAWSEDREPKHEIMGLRHTSLPVHGVQFHPESIATEAGEGVMANFLKSVMTSTAQLQGPSRSQPT
ncbi:MAG: aminodeoxychorismate/anthranilate synthase component II [Gemmatimonadota bacterium]